MKTLPHPTGPGFSVRRPHAAAGPKRTAYRVLTPRDLDDLDDEEATQWGDWRLRGTWLSYEPRGPKHSEYDIDLMTCTDSAHVLDWFAQLAGKTWIDSCALGDLVRALDAIFRLHAFCALGVDRHVDARPILRARARAKSATRRAV